MTAPLNVSTFRTRIDECLSAFVGRQRDRLDPLGPDLVPFLDAAEAFVADGKRLRPQFCRAGWLLAGGGADDPGSYVAAAAFEWLQGSALAHDDLMDESDTRRGRPSLHRAFESRHVAARRAGDAAHFGRSTAVLLGDLMLSWADEMLRSAATVSPTVAANLAAATHYFDVCKSEVVAGQYLDIVGQTHTTFSAAEAMRVVRFKSAKYTVERPLHVGAALAGAEPALLATLSAVGVPLGEAFQLRDDVLGVFGDPAVTGKPAGDDLREGKRTLLIARTAERTDDAGRQLLQRGLGSAEHIDELRALITSTGAAAAVEQDIARLEQEAEVALAALPAPAREQLRPLLLKATRRTH